MKHNNALFQVEQKQSLIEQEIKLNKEILEELREIRKILTKLEKKGITTSTVVERVVESASETVDKFKTKSKSNDFIPSIDTSNLKSKTKKSKKKSVRVNLKKGPNPLDKN